MHAIALPQPPKRAPDLAPAAARIAAGAAALDDAAAFPLDGIDDLRQAGALLAPAPRQFGGQGWGCEPHGAIALLHALRLLGAANLSVGRLFEAHVNALALVAAYGAPAQIARAAHDAAQGHLFGLWVTDGAAPLSLANGCLAGGKAICSGAGHVTRALVTAELAGGGTQMALVDIPAGRLARAAPIKLAGMRAATTGAMDLTGLPADPLGRPGDYLREPLFSAGAWRTAAVILGGLDRLVAITGAELRERGRAGNPHQLARLGQMQIAQETATLWMERAAMIAEQRSDPPATVTGYINLARLAVEAATLDAVRLAQRALGLGAFIQGREIERLIRDLSTYLRQPAPDEALTEAAAHFLHHPLPRQAPPA